MTARVAPPPGSVVIQPGRTPRVVCSSCGTTRAAATPRDAVRARDRHTCPAPKAAE